MKKRTRFFAAAVLILSVILSFTTCFNPIGFYSENKTPIESAAGSAE